MNKRYFLALVNLAIMIALSLFAWDKYLLIKDYFAEFELVFDWKHLLKAMKHDVLVLLLGILSLVGVLFFYRKKAFFFISAFYSSIVLVSLLLYVRSISPSIIILIIGEILFLWLLIWDNVFLVFENKKGFKLISLSIGSIIYFCLFHLNW